MKFIEGRKYRSTINRSGRDGNYRFKGDVKVIFDVNSIGDSGYYYRSDIENEFIGTDSDDGWEEIKKSSNYLLKLV